MSATSATKRTSPPLALLLSLLAACSIPAPSADKCDASTPCTKAGYVCDIPNGYCIGNCGKHACAASEHCVGDTDATKACVPNDTIKVTAPVKDQVIGLLPLSVSALTDSASPIEVDFTLTQSSSSAVSKPPGVTTGNNGVFSTQLPLKAGATGVTGTFVSGSATLVATLQYKSGAGVVQTPKNSDPITVTIDADAPAVTAPTTDQTFYSSLAAPPQVATVTVQVADVGPAGMDSSTVNLTVNGHTYAPNVTPSGGAGAYSFQVPVADLGAAADFQGTVGYTVNAVDKVGNATAFTSGSIPIDNKPPSFSNPVANSTAFYAAASTVPLQIDVSDAVGGSGLDAASVKGKVSGGTATFAPTSTSGATRTFAPLGSDLQADGLQGAVSVVFTAADLVGNAKTSPPVTVQVDRAKPAIGTVTIPANGAAGSGGWYKRDGSGATTVAATVVVDDGAGGSGAASATLTSGSFTGTSTTGAGTGTAKTYTIAVPTSLGTAGAETQVSPAVSAKDAVGNTASGTTAAVLKVDDLGPQISNIVLVSTADYTAPDGTKYFNQTGSTDIEVDATIVDGGSGVSLTSLKLMNGSNQVDKPGTVVAGSGAGVYRFFIARSGGPIGAGASGAVTFSVVAQDNVGNGSMQAQPGTLKLAIDSQAPAVTGPSTDKSFYSTVAPGAPNALVTVQINDQGPSGVDVSTVALVLASPAHSYPPATAPAGGSGAYTFSVPMVDLGLAAGFSGTKAYTVNAKDNAKNAVSFTTGTIPIDNVAPGFTNYVTPSGWLGAGDAVSLSVDVTDTGGAGLLASSVKLGVVGGAAPAIAPTGNSGATFNFAPVGSDLQATNTQGTVSLKYAAADNVGNGANDTTQSVKIDMAAPTVGSFAITQNATAGSGGWYPFDNTGATKVAATLVVDDGPASCAGAACGSGAASAFVALGSFSNTQTTPTGTTGTANTYTFQIPTSVGTANQEVQLTATTLSGKDAAGNTGNGTSTQSLKIDGKPPTIDPAQITLATAGGVVVGPTTWFSQAAGNLEVDAVIVDNGSGVNAGTVQLTATASGTGNGTVVIAGTQIGVTNQYRFLIPRDGGSGALTGPVGTGKEATVTLSIAASDNVGNAATPVGPSGFALGIDGKKPVVTFDMTTPGEYPSANAGCDQTTGGLTTTITCGHDGSRFWRSGDDGSIVFFTATDSGSGTAPAGATCAMNGQSTCTVSYNSGNGHYEFAINPSQATDFASDANGRNPTTGPGSVTITVTASDAVGNVSIGATQAINITRFKWARTLPIGKIKGSPIVTPAISGSRVVLVGGDGSGGSLTTVAALNTQGGVLSGAAAGGVISTNMAYSPGSAVLYTVADGSSKMTAFGVNSLGLGASYTCDYSAAPASVFRGAPAVIGTGAGERVLLADSSNSLLWAMTGTLGTGCGSGVVVKSVALGTGTLKSPTTDGTNAYVVYQNTGIAKVAWNGTSFDAPATLKNLSFNQPIANASLVGASFYLGDLKNYQAYPTDFTGTVAGVWTNTATNGRMGDTILSPPAISGGFVIGVADLNNPPSWIAFNAADGSPTFTYATGAVASSQVAIGSDPNPVYYFTDGGGKLNAIARTGVTASAALAARWSAAFSGAVGSVTFTGPTSEPTLSTDTTAVLTQNTTLYFGADNGTVYAIAVDSPGPVTPTGGTNWPRVGFDNCNSNNSSYTNCQ